jgi:hypothetical protein
MAAAVIHGRASQMNSAAERIERLEAHRAVIGDGFEIRRAVPNRHRRMVGAWCFLDHAGPADYEPGKGLNIGPHPHIGLQTFTWMIEGGLFGRVVGASGKPLIAPDLKGLNPGALASERQHHHRPYARSGVRITTRRAEVA